MHMQETINQELGFDDGLTLQDKLHQFVTDAGTPFQERLRVYLCTPRAHWITSNEVPEFSIFEGEYGQISWKGDFHYLLHDQSVHLVRMCKFAIIGNETYFPAHWTKDMIHLFIKDCVNMGIHQFEYT